MIQKFIENRIKLIKYEINFLGNPCEQIFAIVLTKF
jgi:hypothetical protein